MQFCNIGILTSIQNNNKEVDVARKGDEVCVKIDPVPGEAPKMFGRHFDEKDFLVSKVNNSNLRNIFFVKVIWIFFSTDKSSFHRCL